MPKDSASRNTKVLKTRRMPDGSQQYVRGKTATDRVITAGEYVRATKNTKAQQMLLRAQKAEMSKEARATLSQRAEMEKLRDLARGRVRASIRKQVTGPNVAAKSAYNRIRLKK